MVWKLDEYDKNDSENQSQLLHNCCSCMFEVKSMSSLQMHKKADHKIKMCVSCNFKTTLNALLKKHNKGLHYKTVDIFFVSNFSH